MFIYTRHLFFAIKSDVDDGEEQRLEQHEFLFLGLFSSRDFEFYSRKWGEWFSNGNFISNLSFFVRFSLVFHCSEIDLSWKRLTGLLSRQRELALTNLFEMVYGFLVIHHRMGDLMASRF